ncbi:MAG: ABC transporter ATP-binding protein [bacterium]
MSHAVETVGLGHRYGERAALDALELTAPRGELVALLGPNGSGKSTLFRILATLLRPTSGSARVDGRDVLAEPDAVRRSLGVAFQAESLDGKLSVRENLVHQGHLYGLSGKALGRRVDEVLAGAEVADRAHDRVEKLSGGLRRRADLARALLHRPPVLLLDEPSAGLDPGARETLLAALARYQRDGGSCLLTTHLLEEAERCDRVAILDRGRLVAQGRPEELVREIGGEVVELVTDAPEEVARAVSERFARPATIAEGSVRLEAERGAELLPLILAALPGRIRAASVARPTLADVFFRRTGHRYHAEEE